MTTIERHHWDIGKIYLVIGLSCLLLTASFYLFGLKPLSDHLHAEHSQEIRHFLDSSRWLLEGVLEKHRDLALQSASRTAIRKRQIAYLQGKTSLTDLISFSQPKLADAMRANREIVGISRFDPAGNLLFRVGMPIPDETAARCGLTQLHSIRMIGPVTLGGSRNLLYCSPIFDPDAGRVGADILVINGSSVDHVLNASRNSLSSLGIVHDGRILYWPDSIDDTHARGVLQGFLDNGSSDKAYILKATTVPQTDWELYAVVNRERFFAGIERHQLVLLAAVLTITAAVFAATVLVLRPIINTLMREKHLLDISHRDGMTGLFNHSYLQEIFERELLRAQRHGRLLSVFMFDIDHFKEINDTYGHQSGDIALRCLSDITQATVRQTDFVARYGGEEFMVLLPETDRHSVPALAERLRATVAGQAIDTPTGRFHITISIGVVIYDGAIGSYNRHEIISMADKALYTSKNAGRNRVTIADLHNETAGGAGQVSS